MKRRQVPGAVPVLAALYVFGPARAGELDGLVLIPPLSYGVNDVEVARNAARLVARVLSGQPARNLPIEQPTRFELAVNVKAARALGITIPQSVLLRADEVIQ